MKIIVDAFGGDNAPLEIVLGSLKALELNPDISIVLVGKIEEINKILNTQKFDNSRVEIINADSVITCEDSPTMAIRTKKDSSLVVALEKFKDDKNIIGFVSAGSTGAVLTGALLKVGRIEGVSRPALSPILPTVNGGKVLLIDSGANMDTKPVQLEHFAIMGSAYMKKMYGIRKPRVALLNVGTEDTKGNELAKQAYEVLSALPINFVGNMEARDFLSGNYDVVVADGFWGNVLLKSTEGAVLTLLKMLKNEIYNTTLKAKIGGALLKKNFKNLKDNLDYSNYGGAPFLGVKKVVVKAHGSSKANSIAVAILQAYNMGVMNLCKSIEDEVKKVVKEEVE